LGVYPVTLTDRRMYAYINFDATSGRILTNDSFAKPPAGSLIHSRKDHTKIQRIEKVDEVACLELQIKLFEQIKQFIAFVLYQPFQILSCCYHHPFDVDFQ